MTTFERRCSLKGFLGVLTALLGTVAQTTAQKLPSAPQGPSIAATFVVGNPGDYAGIDRCRSCHKPEFRQYQKTLHASVSVPGKSYISGCEVCHGPGKAHSDAVEAAEGAG